MKKFNWLYWTPRILSIVFLCFLALFSLDMISEGLSFWQIVGGLLMHNIPVFILAIVLWISWKHELVGAITFALAGIGYIITLIISAFNNSFEWYMISWSFTIAGPAFVIAFLWYLNWKKKK
jgi:hypothetical protein